ncbi:MAG: CDP-glycerol glycerophosphotransferase family protein [Candidatus Neomarinimicrobiota bacterium]
MAYRIVFDAYHLYHLPQFDPVIDLLLKDDRFEVFLTTSSETLPDEQALTKRILTKRGAECIFADNEEDRAERIRRLNPDVFICGWSRYPVEQFVSETTLVGMIYHGIGVKPSYWRDNSKRLDVRFVEGPFRIKQLREKGITTDLELTGLTKIDPLFNGRMGGRAEILTALGLDPDKKTLLYGPTFYPSSFETFGLKLPELTKDLNLIIKLHQWSYFMEKFSGVDLRKHIKLINKIKDKYPEVVIIEPEHYNIIDLYQAADVLLTEASSTIYEFMALQKHVIVCDFYKKKLGHFIFPKRIYHRRLDPNMHGNMTDFCFHIKKPKNLPETLVKCFNESDPFDAIRGKYITNMLYRIDGKASERILASLLSRLN